MPHSRAAGQHVLAHKCTQMHLRPPSSAIASHRVIRVYADARATRARSNWANRMEMYTSIKEGALQRTWNVGEMYTNIKSRNVPLKMTAAHAAYCTGITACYTRWTPYTPESHSGVNQQVSAVLESLSSGMHDGLHQLLEHQEVLISCSGFLATAVGAATVVERSAGCRC